MTSDWDFSIESSVLADDALSAAWAGWDWARESDGPIVRVWPTGYPDKAMDVDLNDDEPVPKPAHAPEWEHPRVTDDLVRQVAERLHEVWPFVLCDGFQYEVAREALTTAAELTRQAKESNPDGDHS